MADLPSVSVGDPHAAAHNAERTFLNAIKNVTNADFLAALDVWYAGHSSGTPAGFPPYTTAGRPSASSIGVGGTIYDTDLDLPLWSNGTVYKDGAGTIR